MAEEEGTKQAAIGSDEGINQNQFMNEPDFGAPNLPPAAEEVWLTAQQKARLSDPKSTYYKKRKAKTAIQEPHYVTPAFRQAGGEMLSPPMRRREAGVAFVFLRCIQSIGMSI